MVSTKIIILAVVLFACIVHTQAGSSEDEDKKTNSGFGGFGGLSLDNAESWKNFREMMSAISKNPKEALLIIADSFKTRTKGASKNKSPEKEGDKSDSRIV